MTLDCLFYPLRFDADVSLRHRRAAVLQEPLDKGNVIAIVAVDLSRVPFAEAVRADPLIAQIIADASKDFLHFPCRDGEDQLRVLDPIPQAVVFDVLLNDKGNSKDAPLDCLLLHDGEAEAPAIIHNVTGAELHNVADPQAQVAFQHKSCRHALIGAKEAAAFPHGGDDILVLLCGQSCRFLVHDALQVRFCAAGKFVF